MEGPYLFGYLWSPTISSLGGSSGTAADPGSAGQPLLLTLHPPPTTGRYCNPSRQPRAPKWEARERSGWCSRWPRLPGDGDRSPLSSDPELATESASWTPASPWFASQNLTALFPICEPGSGESHAFVAHETTSAVQAALWASQNPPDCSKARYLVLEKAWHSGFGSAVHIHTRALALAIR